MEVTSKKNWERNTHHSVDRQARCLQWGSEFQCGPKMSGCQKFLKGSGKFSVLNSNGGPVYKCSKIIMVVGYSTAFQMLDWYSNIEPFDNWITVFIQRVNPNLKLNLGTLVVLYHKGKHKTRQTTQARLTLLPLPWHIFQQMELLSSGWILDYFWQFEYALARYLNPHCTTWNFQALTWL